MDEVPAPAPAGSDRTRKAYGEDFAYGFIDAHRERIFVGLAIVGTLLLGPFTVNNFIQGRVLLGLVTSTFLLCLVINVVTIARGRGPAVSASVIFFASVVGLGSAMYNQGLIGILWAYPGILLFHFMLPRGRANLYNVSLVLLSVPMAWMHLGGAMSVRVGVTQVLLIVFSNIFSWIADAQQRKEAEQRARLDAVVRQLEEQNSALREAFRMREEVERIARHDLKTPLASIASVPRLLRSRRALDATEDELVGMVERAALRVLSMVNLSLDLYRMEEGTYRLRPAPVDLTAVLHTVVRELRAHAESKNLRLVLEVPARPLHALGEELLCYSTVANLLKNALEASPEGADVRVSLRAEGAAPGQLVLVIHNLGAVPEPVRDRFFAKYASHGKPGGNGLGAYSAQLMTRVQRGELQMASGPAGTTLTLRLPLAQPASAPASVALASAAAGPLPAAAPLPPVSVLLVDDDEYNIIVLKSLLPAGPVTIRTAVNGRAALERLREARADVVFLDVEMPVMGGIEAIARIRALQAERGERPSLVAAFSAHDDEPTRQRCLEAGFDLYLAKPASRDEVVAVLRRAVPALAAATAADAPAVLVDPALLPLIPEFLASRVKLAQTLTEAVAEGRRETIRSTAHQLAGSLAMYGFEDASRASLDLERAAPAGDLAELRTRCEALTALLTQVRAAPRGA